MSDSTAPLQISKAAARKLILLAQDLLPSRSLKGKDGAKSYLKRVRSIQFDPINPRSLVPSSLHQLETVKHILL